MIDPADVARRVRAEIAAGCLASLAVSVVRDGAVLLEEAFGAADVRLGRPATLDTPFCLASVSKVITATGVLALVERGAIELDRSINDYLLAPVDTAPYPPEAVTVRRVLSHTAGFSEHLQYYFEDEGGEPPPVAETVGRYGVVAFPPGLLFRYSNLGYGILGHLIESVTGRTLDDSLQDIVFGPLGMTNSFVRGGGADRAGGHDGALKPIPLHHADLPAASALWASARDLARFAAFHLDRCEDSPFGDHLRREMQRSVVAVKPGVAMGLGWFLVGDRLLKHEGRTCGVTTSLWLSPADGLSVAIVAGSRTQLVLDLGEEVTRAVLGLPAPELPLSVAPSEGVFGTFVGSVRTFDGEMALSVAAGAEIVCRLGDAAPAVIAEQVNDGIALRGRFTGDLRASDDRRHPPAAALELDLVRVDAELRGALIAVFPSGNRSGDDLSYPVLLRRSA